MFTHDKDTWIELEEAQARLLAHSQSAKTRESVNLEDALFRVLAEDVFAQHDNPPFARSPLDGYALRSEDSGDFANLHVVETLFAGDVPTRALLQKEAVRIMTGAMLPPGANCVIKQEETKRDGDRVILSRKLDAEENVMQRGEDLQKGNLLLEKGRRLGPAELALLAGQGAFEVFARPRVSVVATGSELLGEKEPLQAGKIFDSNSFLLSARCRQLHAQLHVRQILPDEPKRLLRRLDELLTQCELVICTGGVSVGERDYLPSLVRELGAEFLFHGVKVRPGGPALAVSRGGHSLLCLSGNPFAALATFEVLAVPILKKLAGERKFQLQHARAFAKDAFHKPSPMRRLLRAQVSGESVRIPNFGHASSALHSLLDCNCLVDIPAHSKPVCEGDAVQLILFE